MDEGLIVSKQASLIEPGNNDAFRQNRRMKNLCKGKRKKVVMCEIDDGRRDYSCTELQDEMKALIFDIQEPNFVRASCISKFLYLHSVSGYLILMQKMGFIAFKLDVNALLNSTRAHPVMLQRGYEVIVEAVLQKTVTAHYARKMCLVPPEPFTKTRMDQNLCLITSRITGHSLQSTEATTITTSLPEITPFIALQLRVARLEQENCQLHLYHALMEALTREDAMDKEVADKVKDHKRKHDSDDDEDDDDDEGPSAGSKGMMHLASKHPALPSTGWKITDTRDADVDSSMHRSDPESEQSEQSSDNIPMQDEGHVSIWRTLIMPTFPRCRPLRGLSLFRKARDSYT
ncbi:hypothetical protein Tco_0513254 [Tanacetum coccineum]